MMGPGYMKIADMDRQREHKHEVARIQRFLVPCGAVVPSIAFSSLPSFPFSHLLSYRFSSFLRLYHSVAHSLIHCWASIFFSPYCNTVTKLLYLSQSSLDFGLDRTTIALGKSDFSFTKQSQDSQ